jgi:hypothetical protein
MTRLEEITQRPRATRVNGAHPMKETIMARGRSLALCAILVTALGACGGGDSSLTIENDSSFTLFEVNLAAIDDPNWGPDLLGGEVLDPGDTLVITDIDCDTYDVRVVDDTGTECILDAVDLCFDDAVWHLDDIDLAICSF